MTHSSDGAEKKTRFAASLGERGLKLTLAKARDETGAAKRCADLDYSSFLSLSFGSIVSPPAGVIIARSVFSGILAGSMWTEPSARAIRKPLSHGLPPSFGSGLVASYS